MMTGTFTCSGASRKCSSIVWKPSRNWRKPAGPIDEHQRQADRRVDRVAAADPVPEAEHVLGVDAELGDLLGVGADRDEVLGDRGVAQLGGQPAARLARVGERLDRW